MVTVPLRSSLTWSRTTSNSLGEMVKVARNNHAKQAYSDLLTNINAPPVFYSSDGEKAKKVAKRLASHGKQRGLSAAVLTMDSISFDDLTEKEERVAFLTSPAGQGELPQNARTLRNAISSASTCGDRPLTKSRFTVFVLRGQHYLPRPEAVSTNRTSKIIETTIKPKVRNPLACSSNLTLYSFFHRLFPLPNSSFSRRAPHSIVNCSCRHFWNRRWRSPCGKIHMESNFGKALPVHT